jgi:hypothetical protein
MKKQINLVLLIAACITLLTSCNQWAKPNYQGILMENYGRNNKSDFKMVSGKVSTWAWGSEFFQIPLAQQKGEQNDKLTISSTDNTDYYIHPTYVYKVIQSRSVDVLFDYKDISNGDNLDGVEDQILEPLIKDITREVSNSLSDSSLMNNGGKLKYEQLCEARLRAEFEKAGFELIRFSSQLSFTEAMINKIAERNKVEQESQILDKKLANTKKELKLAEQMADANKAKSLGVTELLLKEKELEIKKIAVQGWVNARCPMPQTIVGGNGSEYFNLINSSK